MNTTAAHRTATRIWNVPIFCASISAGTFTCGASAGVVMASPPVAFCFRKYLSREPGDRRHAGATVGWVPCSWSRSDLCRGHGNAHGAAHAGAAEPAIAHRVLGEILLMIILGEIQRRRVADLGGDRSVAFGPERLGVGGFRSLRGGALRGIDTVDRGTILRAEIGRASGRERVRTWLVVARVGQRRS